VAVDLASSGGMIDGVSAWSMMTVRVALLEVLGFDDCHCCSSRGI
jgi:hypothetical protein